MAFTWGMAILSGIIGTFALGRKRLWGIILGALVAQALMFIGGHMLHISFGPVVDMGGTATPVLVDIVMALIGGFIGAAIAGKVRR
jgi:hypothetical protein